MPVWNMKLFLLLSGLAATDAFVVPTKTRPSTTVVKVIPDQWLGSSPSDHYGGAVGPKFEAFDDEELPPQMQKDLETQEKRLADLNSIYPTKEEVAAQVKPNTYEPQENKSRPPQAGKAQISPLSWDGGSMEAGFEKAQKKNAGGADAPFASKGIYKTQEFTTPRYATPSGKPKMIGYNDPTPAEKPVQKAAPVVSSKPANGNVHQNSVRLPPMEGIPQARFSSRPDQPGDWFYHDVRQGEAPRRPAWPVQSYAKNPGSNVAAKEETPAPKAGVNKPELERPPAVDPKELLESKAAAPKTETVPKKVKSPKAVAPVPVASKVEPPKAVSDTKPPEQEIAPEPPLYQQWKQQGTEKRKPPSEGWPQARFSSRPDMPGDWFYHDVPESKSRRPSWPVQSYARSYGRTDETVGYQSVNLPPKQQQPKAKKEPTEEPYAAKENTRRPQDYQVHQATPAGQPKVIGYTPKPKPTPEPVPEPMRPVEPQVQMDVSEGVSTGGDVILTHDHWKSQGRTQKAASVEKLPPMEGIPQAKFTSAPDQPGEWFYDDVSTGTKRPSWPNQQDTRNRPDGWLQVNNPANKKQTITQEQIEIAAEEQKELLKAKAEQQEFDLVQEEAVVAEEVEESPEIMSAENVESGEDDKPNDDNTPEMSQGYY